MAKKDIVVRSAQDLERKYNFASLLGLKKNVEITFQGLNKIENELSSILNALQINLKDVLDSQSDISLWFYSGTPTKSNEPYISFTDLEEHNGDIYYDIESGKVYQFNGKEWELNVDPNLVEAMSITNAETDTTEDHERKVFFDTPQIPYSNGDWWVKEDGTLFICQISKTIGELEKDDFIKADNYTESVAEKIENEITVLKGTIALISDNFAKFTDLATGGSTIISGDNITTGTITADRIQGYNELILGVEEEHVTVETLKNDLNNNYSSKAELEQLLADQEQKIITKTSTTLALSQTEFEVSILQKINTDGVETLKNSLVNIDKEGINVAKSDEDFVSLMSNEGVYTSDGKLKEDLSNCHMKVDRHGAYFKTTEVKGTIKEHDLIQKEKATDEKFGEVQAWYWVGE